MRSMRVLILFAIAFLPLTRALAADDPYAAGLYATHCAQCHDQGGDARVPPRATLEKMTAAAVLRALETGAMRDMGAMLKTPERLALAAYVGKGEASKIDQFADRCAVSPSTSSAAGSAGWSGWGQGLANWRFQDAAGAGLSAADVPKLKLKWAFGVPEATSMRSQPAVYAGRIFVAGPGQVYSLDAKTGCVHWATNAAAAIRSGITIAPLKSGTLVVFGDETGEIRALDASTGEPVWHLRADEHPASSTTSTPVFYKGRLYFGVSSGEEGRAVMPGYVCCTFRGSVQAVDAATGKAIWKTYTVTKSPEPGKLTKGGAKTLGPSGAGVWSAPTIDPEHNVLYATTGDNYSDPATSTSDAVLALALDTGKILWSKQLTEGDAFNGTCGSAAAANCPDANGPDADFGSSAILMRLDGKRRVLVLAQKSGMLHGVDPDQQGKILWQSRVGEGGRYGGIQWGAAADGNRVYVGLSDIRFTASTGAGRHPDPEKGGGMFAFVAASGERAWVTAPAPCGERKPCSPAQSQAVSAMPGAVFSGSNDGHFRAYSSSDGKVIWDYDTMHDYNTVNSVPAKGGALDAGGPVIANGMVFVGSGYAQFGGAPGNVLLAFGVE
jgi:polyvinyl alcohol dehydrogenase (cytochrome)